MPAAPIEPVTLAVHLEDVDVVGEAIEERPGVPTRNAIRRSIPRIPGRWRLLCIDPPTSPDAMTWKALLLSRRVPRARQRSTESLARKPRLENSPKC